MDYNKISVIGAGNGGQAIAGHCAALGYSVCLYNRNLQRLASVVQNPYIELKGALTEKARLYSITDSIQEAVSFADVILIVTTATAHREIAEQMLPYLRNNQLLILNPGRTCGVLEVDAVLKKRSDLTVFLAEAQTLVYACREIIPGIVNIIGIKDKVLVAGRNRKETSYVVEKMKPIFPCFLPADSLIQTGLENIGAIFHPSIVLFNAATIERNSSFYFYRDLTPNVASCITQLDNERIAIGKAYGVDLMPVFEWIVYAYPNTWGETLCERMCNNPAYYDIKGPGTIFTRQLTEDIPTGLVPMSELAHLASVSTPLMDSMIVLSSALLGTDFKKQGRSLENLGLLNMKKETVIALLS